MSLSLASSVRIVSLVSLFSLVMNGCEKAEDTGPIGEGCTEIGCVDGFSLSFEKAGIWDAGIWTVVVEVDGVAVTCETTFPLDSEGLTSCDAEGVLLELSGSALPAKEQAISGVIIQSVDFTSLSVSLSLDGKLIATEDFTPEWVTSQPNGPDCEPICTNDSASMSL